MQCARGVLERLDGVVERRDEIVIGGVRRSQLTMRAHCPGVISLPQCAGQIVVMVLRVPNVRLHFVQAIGQRSPMRCVPGMLGLGTGAPG